MRLNKAAGFPALLILLASIACAGCESSGKEVGLSAKYQGIVNGKETNYEIWKGAVGLYGVGLYGVDIICSGTLIAPNVVLSTGSCVYCPNSGLDFVKNPERLQIQGGPAIGDILYSYAEEVVVHPSYNGFGVDLSMIKLETPIEDVKPHKLRMGSLTRGEKGVIVGYGRDEYGGMSEAGIHRWGETTILSLGANIGLGDPCGLCNGDSGGPFFTKEDSEWVVTGVSAWNTNQCSPDKGSISINVLTYRNWIDKVFREFTGEGLDGPSEDTDTNTDIEPDAGNDSETDQEPDSGTDSGSNQNNYDDASNCTVTGAGHRFKPSTLMRLFDAALS
ncbi:MAG: trypsin-like serine protease [Deltaproteobacteria bacterium]|nr:trypsin-like serine protease [Deltaproteobacteria bacterium]